MKFTYRRYKLPIRVAQLVMANIRKCGPNTWHIVLGSNPATDDTLKFTGASCCKAVSTPRFGSPSRVLRAWPWKVPWLSKNKTHIGDISYSSVTSICSQSMVRLGTLLERL